MLARRACVALTAQLAIISSLCLLVAFATPTACAKHNESGVFPLTLTDSLKRKVTLAKAPQRIVSLAPSNTEILFAIGAGDAVVGVTTYDDFPPEVKKRNLVGGFLPKSVSLEKIVALKADLVLIAAGVQTPLIDTLERLRIPVIVLDARDFDDLYDNMRMLGRVTDKVMEAEKRIADMRQRVDQVRARAAKVTPERRPTVFYMLWEEPLMTVGRHNFISQMVELAGGRNLFPELEQEFPRISGEEILRRKPQVIIGADLGGTEKVRARLAQRPGWKSLPAMQNNRIGFVDENIVSRPGPRLVEGLEAISRLLHPHK